MTIKKNIKTTPETAKQALITTKKLLKTATSVLITSAIALFSTVAVPAFALASTSTAIVPQTSFVSNYNYGSSQSTSMNWAGYVETGSNYTGVSGTWTIPNVTASSSTAADATWVGIGGVNSNDLIQAGTQAIVDSFGNTEYLAWYETLPNSATTVTSMKIKPGDSVTATLTQQSTGQWTLVFKNNTTGFAYQTNIAYTSSLSSAEWVEEMPTDTASGNFLALDNFGTINFSNASVTQNGLTENLQQSGAQSMTLINAQNMALATTSALGADGASFSVTRTSIASSASTPIVTGRTGYSTGYTRGGNGNASSTGRRIRTSVGVDGFNTHPSPYRYGSSQKFQVIPLNATNLGQMQNVTYQFQSGTGTFQIVIGK